MASTVANANIFRDAAAKRAHRQRQEEQEEEMFRRRELLRQKQESQTPVQQSAPSMQATASAEASQHCPSGQHLQKKHGHTSISQLEPPASEEHHSCSQVHPHLPGHPPLPSHQYHSQPFSHSWDTSTSLMQSPASSVLPSSLDCATSYTRSNPRNVDPKRKLVDPHMQQSWGLSVVHQQQRQPNEVHSGDPVWMEHQQTFPTSAVEAGQLFGLLPEDETLYHGQWWNRRRRQEQATPTANAGQTGAPNFAFQAVHPDHPPLPSAWHYPQPHYFQPHPAHSAQRPPSQFYPPFNEPSAPPRFPEHQGYYPSIQRSPGIPFSLPIHADVQRPPPAWNANTSSFELSSMPKAPQPPTNSTFLSSLTTTTPSGGQDLPPLRMLKGKSKEVLLQEVRGQAQMLVQLQAMLASLRPPMQPSSVRPHTSDALPPLRKTDHLVKRRAFSQNAARIPGTTSKLTTASHHQSGTGPSDSESSNVSVLTRQMQGRQHRELMAKAWLAPEEVNEGEVETLVKWVEELDFEHFMHLLESRASNPFSLSL